MRVQNHQWVFLKSWAYIFCNFSHNLTVVKILCDSSVVVVLFGGAKPEKLQSCFNIAYQFIFVVSVGHWFAVNNKVIGVPLIKWDVTTQVFIYKLKNIQQSSLDCTNSLIHMMQACYIHNLIINPVKYELWHNYLRPVIVCASALIDWR